MLWGSKFAVEARGEYYIPFVNTATCVNALKEDP